jgi:hypothetical protein
MTLYLDYKDKFDMKLCMKSTLDLVKV